MKLKPQIRLCERKAAEFAEFANGMLPDLRRRVELLAEIASDINALMEPKIEAKPRSTAPAYFTGAAEVSDVVEKLLREARDTLAKWQRAYAAITGLAPATDETEDGEDA